MTYLSSPLQIGRKTGTEIIRAGVLGTSFYDGGFVEIVPSGPNQGLIQPWTNGSNAFAGIVLGGTIVTLDTLSQGGVAPFTSAKPQPRGIKVGRGGAQLYRYPYAAAAVTDLGSAVYASDDHTITLDAQTTQIGKVVDWESGFLWIDITGYCV